MQFPWSNAAWAAAIEMAQKKNEAHNLSAVMHYAAQLSGLKKSAVDTVQERIVNDLSRGAENDFNVWVPNAMELVKGGSTDDKWRIQGFCSTEDQDSQQETLIQKGLDFSYFVQRGWFNDNHAQHTGSYVGVPEMAELRPQGWWTKGFLFKHVPRAVEIYKLAKALELENVNRQLGFSVEGKVVLRDPMQSNRILKARIINVAITGVPINANATWSLVSKAFANPEVDSAKSLMAGAALVPTVGGDAVRKEDNEAKLRDLGWAGMEVNELGEIARLFTCGKCKKSFFTEEFLNVHMGRTHFGTSSTTSALADNPLVRKANLDRQDAIQYILRVRPGYSEKTAARFVDYLFREKE